MAKAVHSKRVDNLTSTGLLRGTRETEEGPLDPEQIARLAYSYWEGRGFQGGSPEEDWYRAEADIRSRSAKMARAADEPSRGLAASRAAGQSS